MQKGDERGQIGKAHALTAAWILKAEAPYGRFSGRLLPDAQQVGVVCGWLGTHLFQWPPAHWL